jgi:hypothetical protein
MYSDRIVTLVVIGRVVYCSVPDTAPSGLTVTPLSRSSVTVSWQVSRFGIGIRITVCTSHIVSSRPSVQ